MSFSSGFQSDNRADDDDDDIVDCMDGVSTVATACSTNDGGRLLRAAADGRGGAARRRLGESEMAVHANKLFPLL